MMETVPENASRSVSHPHTCLELGDSGGVVFQEAQERVDCFGANFVACK